MRFSTFLKLVIPGIAVCGCTQRDIETEYDVVPVPETHPTREGMSPMDLQRQRAKEQSDLRVTEPPHTPGPEAMADPATLGLTRDTAYAAESARIERVDTRIAALGSRIQDTKKDQLTLIERLEAIRGVRAVIERDRAAVATTTATDWDTLHEAVETNLATLEMNVDSLEATLGPEPLP